MVPKQCRKFPETSCKLWFLLRLITWEIPLHRSRGPDVMQGRDATRPSAMHDVYTWYERRRPAACDLGNINAWIWPYTSRFFTDVNSTWVFYTCRIYRFQAFQWWLLRQYSFHSFHVTSVYKEVTALNLGNIVPQSSGHVYLCSVTLNLVSYIYLVERRLYIVWHNNIVWYRAK